MSQQRRYNPDDEFAEPPPQGIFDNVLGPPSEDEDAWFGGRNPLVPAGCLLTAGVLGRGLFTMYHGDKVKSQKMMRARVVAQGVTVIIIAAGALSARWNKPDVEQPQPVALVAVVAVARPTSE